MEEKMKVSPGVADAQNVVGFVKVENFDGKSIHLNPKYLKDSLEMMTILDGLDDIEIGISNHGLAGAFFIFTDKEQKSAIAIAGRALEE